MTVEGLLPQEEPDEGGGGVCFMCREHTADPLITVCVDGRDLPVFFHPACVPNSRAWRLATLWAAGRDKDGPS